MVADLGADLAVHLGVALGLGRSLGRSLGVRLGMDFVERGRDCSAQDSAQLRKADAGRLRAEGPLIPTLGLAIAVARSRTLARTLIGEEGGDGIGEG